MIYYNNNSTVIVKVRRWACRCPARALAPVSPVCRLIETLWDLDEREKEWKGRGHGQAKNQLGLGHLKEFMRMRFVHLTV